MTFLDNIQSKRAAPQNGDRDYLAAVLAAHLDSPALQVWAVQHERKEATNARRRARRRAA